MYIRGETDLVWPELVNEVVHVDKQNTQILDLLLPLCGQNHSMSTHRFTSRVLNIHVYMVHAVGKTQARPMK